MPGSIHATATMAPRSVKSKTQLSFRQRQVLEYVAKGNPMAGCNRQCDYGGRTTTLWSLKRRGLVHLEGSSETYGWALTEEGKQALAVPGAKSITML